MCTSKKKYIIAARALHSLGHFLAFQIRKILDNVIFQTNIDGGMFDVIREIDRKDVVVALSFPRYNRSTIDFAKYAKEQKAKIISITDSKISPIYKLSDVSLFCPYESSAFFTS